MSVARKGNFTQFRNDVLEYLCDTSNHLTVYQYAVLLAVIRATWGFRKAESRITAGQIAKATGIIKNNVYRTLKELEELGIITRQNGIIGVSPEISCTNGRVSPEIQKGISRDTKGVSPEIQNGALETPVSSSSATFYRTPEKPPKESIKESIKKERKIDKKKVPPTRAYGEFKNILLTDEDYKILIDRFGEGIVSDAIETAGNWIESHGKRYKNYRAFLQNWIKRDDTKAKRTNDSGTGRKHHPGAKFSDGRPLRNNDFE